MKKFLIFSISFILAYVLIHIVSGILLTFLDTPNVSDAWNRSATLPQETRITSSRSSTLFPFILAFISAAIAFFIAESVNKRNTGE